MPESGISEAEGRRSASERDETAYKLSEKYPRTTPEQVTRHRQFMRSECKTVAVGRGDRYFTATKRVISAAMAGTGRAILDETTERLAYRMGRLTIYPFHRVMARDGVLVKKPRSTFLGVAIYFARHAGIDLAKRQIIEGAWLGTTVSDKNLSTYVVQLREAIGHEGSIATLHNFGYKNVTPTDILSGKDAEPPRAFTAPRIVKLHRSDIPLVGREMELARLTDLVRDYRVVSLVGPTGVGKTRLANELGWRLAAKYLDGVALVELASLKTGPGVALAVATALAQALDLQLQATETPIETIADAIADRQMLLIADNAEHIAKDVADIVAKLGERAPDLTILVTSQHVIDGLHHNFYRLNGLAVPPETVTDPVEIAKYDAVKLFAERARAYDRTFTLDRDSAAGVAEICRRLDGIAQSLKIAASFIDFSKVEGVRVSLDDRLRLLRLDEGAEEKRHMSLEDMAAWSYEKIDPAEQQFFCRLGVFPGLFSIDEAVAIVGDDLASAFALLRRLVKKSMVARQVDGQKEPRFRLLETMRLYANQQADAMGERKPIATRHLRYFQDLVTRDAEAWETLPDSQLRQIYAPHIENLRAALDTALTDPELAQLGISLFGASGRLWSLLVLIPEGRGYADRFLPLIDETTPPADAARVLRYAGILYRHADRLYSTKLLEQAETIYRESEDRLNLGAVLAVLGGNYIYLGRHEEAKKTLDDARTLLSDSNHIKSLRDIMNASGNLALIKNDIIEAARCLGIAGDLAREMGDSLRENITLLNLGDLEQRRGAIDQAIECARTAVNNLQSVDETSYHAKALTNLAAYLILRGDYAEARLHAEDRLPLLIQEGGHWLRLRLLAWTALAAAAGEIAPAAKMRGWVEAVRSKAGEIMEPTEQALDDFVLKVLKTYPRPEDVEIWMVEGARWPAKYAIDFTMRRIVVPPGQSDSASEQNLL